jgi:ABC-type dipeptide/oligopeptide/nickel transport system ATPase component
MWETREQPRPAQDVAPILEVRNLHVAYFSATGTATPAIADVSFELRPGEILGVLRESGSGKRTVASSLLSLLPASARIQQGLACRFKWCRSNFGHCLTVSCRRSNTMAVWRGWRASMQTRTATSRFGSRAAPRTSGIHRKPIPLRHGKRRSIS